MIIRRFLHILAANRLNPFQNMKFLQSFIVQLYAVSFNPRRFIRNQFEKSILLKSELFDCKYYLSNNPYLASSAINPLDHFLIYGWKEERNPHPLFDINFYWEAYPDVKKSKTNPFIHFIRFGWKEGRNPHPLFDTSFYLESNPDLKNPKTNPFIHFNFFGWKEERNPHPLFDIKFYFECNPKLRGMGVNPIVHFVQSGYKEGCNPHFLFDVKYYLTLYEDVKNAGINPLIHYLMSGAREGRKPHPLFDTTYYFENNEDVKKANINPLVHFILSGWKEGRKPFENFNIQNYRTHNQNIEESIEFPFFNYLRNNYRTVDFEYKHPQDGITDTSILNQNLKQPAIKKNRIVVVFHVYHVDLVDECIKYLKNIPFNYDIIITTSLDEECESIEKIKRNFANVQVVKCKNEGRDIGAFIKVWPMIQQFDICCKIHTKKGDSAYIETWRKLCLEGVLGSSDLVTEIVNHFENDSSILLAGPELLYGSFKELIGINSENIQFLSKEYSIPLNNAENNGFFMGSMFWIRIESFPFISHLCDLKFPPETGKNEGGYEHAIERILGSLTLQKSQKIILTRSNEANLVSYKIVDFDYQSKVTTFHKHFDSIVNSQNSIEKIRGFIDQGEQFMKELYGWLALIGDKTPREAIVLIKDKLEIDVLCSIYRNDLEDNGINKGEHLFKIKLPVECIDGLPLEVTLIDKLSGKIVHTATIFKKKLSGMNIDRTYFDWDKVREEKFYKTINEIKLKRKDTFHGLVSVIMPTYNRANIIDNAIRSVISQTYSNFELIIVDDESTDDTEQIIHKYQNDKRIKYIKQIKGGPSSARNLGLKESVGEYIFYLDSDNEWVENYLQTTLDYMYYFNLDSAYSGMIVVDEKNQFKYFRGSNFSWFEIRYLNYVDLNSFGHKNLAGEDKLFFDEELERWVDWDYILRFITIRTISYAPFLGIKYYDGNIDRITNTAYKKFDEVNIILSHIRDKFSNHSRLFHDVDFIFESLLEKYRSGSMDHRVSVDTIITSYNHEKFITQAIESVLEQKGNIRHRIIISDDASTDNTRKIISRYSKKYPEFIVELSSVQNLGMSENFKKCLYACNAEYVALCEGDDYWTDSYKLQKQIAFMKENFDCSMVFSKIEVHNIEKNSIRILKRQETIKKEKLDGEDFIADPNMNLIANFSCCLFKADLLKTMPAFLFNERITEIAFAFYFEQFGKIGYIDKVMSVYRQHIQGLWSGSDYKNQLISGMKTRQIVKEVAQPKYKDRIQKIIEEKFLSPLKEMS